jgi:hypothetical protein
VELSEKKKLKRVLDNFENDRKAPVQTTLKAIPLASAAANPFFIFPSPGISFLRNTY